MYAGHVYPFPPAQPPVATLMAPRLSAHAQGILVPPSGFRDGPTDGEKSGWGESSARDRGADERRKAEGAVYRDVHLLSSLDTAAREASLRFVPLESPVAPVFRKTLPYGYTRPGNIPPGLYGCLDLASTGLDCDPLSRLPATALVNASSNPGLPAYLMHYHPASLPSLHNLPPSVLNNYYPLLRPDTASLHHHYQQQQQYQQALALSHRHWAAETGASNPPHLCPGPGPPPLDNRAGPQIYSDAAYAFPPPSLGSVQGHRGQISSDCDRSSTPDTAAASDKSGRFETESSARPRSRRNSVEISHGSYDTCDTPKDGCPQSPKPRVCGRRSPVAINRGSRKVPPRPSMSPGSPRHTSPWTDSKATWKGIPDSKSQRQSLQDNPVKAKSNASKHTPTISGRQSLVNITSEKGETCDRLVIDIPTSSNRTESNQGKLSPRSIGDIDRVNSLPDSTLDISRPPSQSNAVTPHEVTSSVSHLPPQTSSSPPLSPTTTTATTKAFRSTASSPSLPTFAFSSLGTPRAIATPKTDLFLENIPPSDQPESFRNDVLQNSGPYSPSALPQRKRELEAGQLNLVHAPSQPPIPTSHIKPTSSLEKTQGETKRLSSKKDSPEVQECPHPSESTPQAETSPSCDTSRADSSYWSRDSSSENFSMLQYNHRHVDGAHSDNHPKDIQHQSHLDNTRNDDHIDHTNNSHHTDDRYSEGRSPRDTEHVTRVEDSSSNANFQEEHRSAQASGTIERIRTSEPSSDSLRPPSLHHAKRPHEKTEDGTISRPGDPFS